MTTMVPGPFSSRPYWRVPLSGSTSAIWAGVSHRQDAAGKDVPGAGGSRRPWSINSLLALFGVSQLTCSALARREGPCRRLASLMRPRDRSRRAVRGCCERSARPRGPPRHQPCRGIPAGEAINVYCGRGFQEAVSAARAGRADLRIISGWWRSSGAAKLSRHLCPSPADQDHSRGTRAKPAERCRAPGCKQFKTRISAGRTLSAPIMRLRRCAEAKIRTPCSALRSSLADKGAGFSPY